MTPRPRRRRSTIRRLDAGDEAGLEAYVAIRNATTPDSPDSLEHLRLGGRRRTPAGGRCSWRAVAGRPPSAAASAGRIYMHGPDYERCWLGLWVVPEARRRGIGTRALPRAARRGPGRRQDRASRPSCPRPTRTGIAFLARRGFVEVERTKAVRLDLRRPRSRRPSSHPPAIALTTLAERPDLLAGVHRVAVEAYPDIPSADEPMDARHARRVRRPRRRPARDPPRGFDDRGRRRRRARWRVRRR